MTDELIIHKVLEGNTHIFSLLVDRYKDKVFGLVYRFTNDFGEAQDVSQEVFMKIFKSLHLFEEKSKFSTWVYKICYNVCIDWTRKNKKRIKQLVSEGGDALTRIEDDTNIEDSYIERQKSAAIRQAIGALPEKYRTVLILFHYQGLTYEEIGEILGMPVKTVETRLYRGRGHLRKRLYQYSLGGDLCEMQAGKWTNG